MTNIQNIIENGTTIFEIERVESSKVETFCFRSLKATKKLSLIMR